MGLSISCELDRMRHLMPAGLGGSGSVLTLQAAGKKSEMTQAEAWPEL